MAREHRFVCNVCGASSPWSADERLPPGWAVLTGTGEEIPGPMPIRPVHAFDVCSTACISLLVRDERSRLALNASPQPLTLEAPHVASV